jgi:single stranded DNA-binding protein
MNKFMGNGRLTRDPETVQINDKTLTKFSLAINDRPYVNNAGEKITPVAFLDCELWGNGADWFGNNMKKGDRVLISDSRLKQDTWEDKNGGGKRSKIVLVVNQFEKLDWDKAEEEEAKPARKAPAQARAPKAAPAKGKSSRMKEFEDDEVPSFEDEGNDIPF